MKKKLVAGLLVVFALMTLGLITIPEANCTAFVISSWVSDDGNGQGIISIHPYDNATGVWMPIHYFDGEPLYVIEPDDDTTVTMNYTENTALRFAIRYTLNKSYVGISTYTEGYNVIRGGVSVRALGATIHSESNLTMYLGGVSSTHYWYFAYAIIPVLIQAGITYTISFTYEIYPYLYE